MARYSRSVWLLGFALLLLAVPVFGHHGAASVYDPNDKVTLKGTVTKLLWANPHIEVALAGTIVTDGEGKYICHRQPLVPHPQHIWFRFLMLTSSVFIRRKVIHERGIFFDTSWRDLGDVRWAQALLAKKVPVAVCNSTTSIFADTGENMNLKPNAIDRKSVV